MTACWPSPNISNRKCQEQYHLKTHLQRLYAQNYGYRYLYIDTDTWDFRHIYIHAVIGFIVLCFLTKAWDYTQGTDKLFFY